MTREELLKAAMECIEEARRVCPTFPEDQFPIALYLFDRSTEGILASKIMMLPRSKKVFFTIAEQVINSLPCEAYLVLATGEAQGTGGGTVLMVGGSTADGEKVSLASKSVTGEPLVFGEPKEITNPTGPIMGLFKTVH